MKKMIFASIMLAVVLSMITPYVMQTPVNDMWRMIPFASAKTAALALGAGVGLIISLLLVRLGVLKSSFAEIDTAQAQAEENNLPMPEVEINIRNVMVREMAFLAPVVLLGWAFMAVLGGADDSANFWQRFISEQKWLAGLLGSVFGFMIGGGVVWATRILGTLAFGREAMGLGDVHLMAAVGAMLGWMSPTIAFFVAPFFGLAWAIARLLIHRSREIPYGPFLSVATVLVMVMFDPIVDYFLQALQGPPLPG